MKDLLSGEDWEQESKTPGSCDGLEKLLDKIISLNNDTDAKNNVLYEHPIDVYHDPERGISVVLTDGAYKSIYYCSGSIGSKTAINYQRSFYILDDKRGKYICDQFSPYKSEVHHTRKMEQIYEIQDVITARVKLYLKSVTPREAPENKAAKISTVYFELEKDGSAARYDLFCENESGKEISKAVGGHIITTQNWRAITQDL
ncbi:hypothetical protein JW756_01895 [Candidatus Woesearchaeota archaeon]|nr:hypothetical protein [Candidatus Woesearchaeota archaeon]